MIQWFHSWTRVCAHGLRFVHLAREQLDVDSFFVHTARISLATGAGTFFLGRGHRFGLTFLSGFDWATVSLVNCIDTLMETNLHSGAHTD